MNSRTLSRSLVVTFAIIACAGPGIRADRPPDRAATATAITRLLASVYPPGEPGAVVLVAKDGQALVRQAFGEANLELGVPLRPDSVMPIASLSKSFTAAAILALAERGRLSLHDDIRRFLPSYPVHGETITIEHLLTHTSGISSLSDTADLRASANPEAAVTEVMKEWFRNLPPDAPPGERWTYSNWGYNLLAAIVEEASGSRYAEFVKQTLLDPLGMAHTFYLDRRQVTAGRVAGYETSPNGFSNALPSRSRVLQPNGAAGWMSTVDDLARWSEGLAAGGILTRASVDAMFTPYHLKDGSSTNYGYGWDLGEYAGHAIQEHQGGTTGFTAHIVRVPDAHVLVVILSNRTSAPVPLATTAHRSAAMALGVPIADPVPVKLDRGTLAQLAGRYRGADVGTCTVATEGDALTIEVAGLGRLRLIPVGGLTFRSSVVTWSFTFETDAEGRATRLRVRDWKLNDVADRFVPAAAQPRSFVAVTDAELAGCAGTYESLNGILVSVERAGTHLAIHPFDQPPVEVFPVAPLVYTTSDGVVEYRFVRDATGEIAAYQRAAGTAPVPARRIR